MATRIPKSINYAAVAAQVVGADEPDLIRRLVHSMLIKRYPPNTDAVARAFEPSWMYEDGTEGVAWSAARPWTLDQTWNADSPVTASGQTVGRVKDISGHDHHLSSNLADRHLTFVTDSEGRMSLQGLGATPVLSTAAINCTAYTKATMFIGLSPQSSAAVAIPHMMGNVGSSLGSFYMRAPGVAGQTTLQMCSVGATTLRISTYTDSAFPITRVMVGEADLTAPFIRLRRDGVQVHNITTDQGGGTYGTYGYKLGAQNNTGNPFRGPMYAGGFIMKHLSPGYLRVLEAWLTAQTHPYVG